MKRSLSTPNFDRIARPYRWLEYFTFGFALQKTRISFLPRLLACRNALLFGDGDGRFLVQLLAQNPRLIADAIDTSAAMLNLLRKRAKPFVGSNDDAKKPGSSDISRLRTHHQNALTFNPTNQPDLVATHFFLDCLPQPDLDRLIDNLAPSLAPEALWVVSEFRIPPSALRLPARLLIRGLYVAFRILTGLRVTHLPAYHPALTRAGFKRIAHRHRFAGLLTAELWQRHRGTEHEQSSSHTNATNGELGYPHT